MLIEFLNNNLWLELLIVVSMFCYYCHIVYTDYMWMKKYDFKKDGWV